MFVVTKAMLPLMVANGGGWLGLLSLSCSDLQGASLGTLLAGLLGSNLSTLLCC